MKDGVIKDAIKGSDKGGATKFKTKLKAKKISCCKRRLIKRMLPRGFPGLRLRNAAYAPP
jgi:hypothetical protein